MKRKKAPTNINNLVNARELHEFLGSKRQFGNWIQQRIEQYGFIEGRDYQVLHYDIYGNLLSHSLHKTMKIDTQPHRKEYAISINMAKEYDFIEGEDYEVFDKFVNNPNGGRPINEYAITLNMAKEYEFIEGEDYVCFHKFVKGDAGRGGNKKTTEYAISIDMAKELHLLRMWTIRFFIIL